MKINWAVVLVVGLILLLVFVVVSVSLSNKSDCESQGQESIYEWKTGRCFENTKQRCDFYRHNYEIFSPSGC